MRGLPAASWGASVTSSTGAGATFTGATGGALTPRMVSGYRQAAQWLAAGSFASPHSSQKTNRDDCCIDFFSIRVLSIFEAQSVFSKAMVAGFCSLKKSLPLFYTDVPLHVF